MLNNIKTLQDIDVKGKVVLCRVDLNVPMKNGRVEDLTRIKALIPTLEELIKREAKLVVISHFGRPNGNFVREMSLAPLVSPLSQALGGREVRFALDSVGEDAKGAVDSLKKGEVLLLENLRFHKGEEANDSQYVNALAKLGEIYVNDTFSCSHREHASITGLAQKLPAAAGLLLQKEIENLQNYIGNCHKPFAAIVGGSKVSTKLKLLKSLLKTTNLLVIGGAMANTFLYAKGFKIGKSLYEHELVLEAKSIIEEANKQNCDLVLPIDVVMADKLDEVSICKIVDIDAIDDEYMVLDFGPKSLQLIADKLADMKTIIWNGPIGAFEVRPFDVGSITLARIIASYTKKNEVVTVAGGGDVVAAINLARLSDSFSYISTAGGAFLEWIEEGSLPGIEVLKS